MGVTAIVVQINISVGYLERNGDKRKIVLEGIQHSKFDTVTINSCNITPDLEVFFDFCIPYFDCLNIVTRNR